MKNLLLALLLCAFSGTLFSISAEDKAIIHLKTGEFIPGVIISRNDTNVQIKSDDDGKTYSFDMTEVNYISHKNGSKKDYSQNNFRGFIDIGYALGVGSPRNNAFEIDTSFGYQFSHYFYLGGGLGIHFLSGVFDSYPLREDTYEPVRNDPNWRYPFIPIYVNVRSNLYDESRITPFVDARVGATFINHTGLYCAPAIGVHFPTTSSFALNVSLAYELHATYYKFWCRGNTPGAIPDSNGGTYVKNNKGFSSFALKFGVEF